jgi:uncharacterized protein (DUF302 family)
MAKPQMGVQVMAADGLITMKSTFDPKETIGRLEAEVRTRGMTVFAHVDHAAGAAGPSACRCGRRSC